jgi:PAS domain-containing protein
MGNNRLSTIVLPTTKRNNHYRHPIGKIKKQSPSTAAVELRYRAILEQIPAVIYTDSVGEFNQTLYINPQVEAITGYTADEWMADTFGSQSR